MQIFKDGKLAGFVDGSDEKVSSWMRFIRCARHKKEQNLFAFQFLGKIYYRSFKAVLPGEEMLVWYDEKYPQYLGIPSAIFDLGAVTGKGTSFRIMTLFTWSEGPRSSGVDFFCFVSPRAGQNFIIT